MATPQIKSTYSMDLETTQLLEGLARRWQVSKSEALRRAIRAAAGRRAETGAEALKALDALQEAARLTGPAARSWEAAVRAERRAASRKREGRTR